jgi:hypothetical protein
MLVAFLSIAIVGLASQTGNSFEIGIHEEITRQALGFLDAKILDDIVDEHRYVDSALLLSSKWHFDNCVFKEATENINSQYDKVLGYLDPAKPDDFNATDEFGQLLHAVQDFYAHSNWVDMGRRDLIDAGLGRWTVLMPWSKVRPDVIVIQGETPPAGWQLTRNERIVTVTIPGQGNFQGLISGTFGLSDDCPNNIAMGHGDLNKDEATRQNFGPARNLAVEQTIHEWCRLESLVLGKYGQAGLTRLRNKWFKPGVTSPCGGGGMPTLTEWGLIALAVLLAGSLAFMIRRRLAPRPAEA